jgi:hypothetical protein
MALNKTNKKKEKIMKDKLLILCVLLISNNSQSTTFDLETGLIANYEFIGNTNDTSGNGNNGAGGNILSTTDRFGNNNSAFEFNGTNSFININNSDSLMSPTNELTMVAWINAYSWSLVGSTNFAPVLMKSDLTGNAFQYRMSISDGGFSIAINNWTNFFTSEADIVFNQWHMIAITYKDNLVKGYFNGVLVDEGPIVGPIALNTLPLEIGRDIPGATEVFNGKIDDVRIYNRELNDLEILELFNKSDLIYEDGFE